MNLLDIKNISYRYSFSLDSAPSALERLSFSVKKGEKFALLGPNGSGKSTLFSLISGYTNIQEGEIYFQDELLGEASREQRSKMGICFQSPSLDPLLTVEENLVLQGQVHGLSKKIASSKALNLIEEFSLSEHRSMYTSKLSGGMKRRVEILKSLMPNDVQLLLLDEPTTGLDPIAKASMWNFIAELQNKSEMTVLFTTHLMDEAESVDRLCFMKDGHPIFTGSPKEVKSKMPSRIIQITPYEKNIFDKIKSHFGKEATWVNNQIIIEHDHKLDDDLVGKLIREFSDDIQELTIKAPTLEEAFIWIVEGEGQDEFSDRT